MGNGMNDADIHERMAKAYHEQALANSRAKAENTRLKAILAEKLLAKLDREFHPSADSYKNRTLVHAKLDRESYASLWAYAKTHDLSINSAIKKILQHFFKIKNNV
jgi:hypothetical protein